MKPILKPILTSTALALMTLASPAASLNTVEAGAPALQCLFNPACTNLAQEGLSPIVLPGTTGTGFLQTRVIQARTNSMAAGLFGYEYRVDLSGIVADTNHPVCLTNVVRCKTNSVEVRTNQVVCRTNILGVVKALACITNTIPATNIVISLTNKIAATNLVQCFTNAAGARVCFTNTFPATNVVLQITNRIPARTLVVCQTNIIDPGQPVVRCVTNHVKVQTLVVTCRTNVIPCPGAPPCIESVRIKFGDISPLDFNQDGTNDEVYVVASGGSGTVRPASVQRSGKEIVIRFSPPLCAGQSSLTVGLLSARPPGNVEARVTLSSGSLKAGALAPGGSSLSQCDFEGLADKLQGLRTRDFVGPNDSEREIRRQTLLGYHHAAAQAAQAGDVDGVLTALAQIIVRADGGANDWLTRPAAHQVNEQLKDLLDCLEDASGRDLDHDGHNGTDGHPGKDGEDEEDQD